MSAYVPQPYNELLDSSLSYAAQTLTDPQKAQALTNLGAASVAYVGANFAAISHNHSADHITSGALAKARQHAQTAYYDAAGTWAQAQVFQGATFNGTVIAKNGISFDSNDDKIQLSNNLGYFQVGSNTEFRLRAGAGGVRVFNHHTGQLGPFEAGTATFNGPANFVDSGGGSCRIDGRYITFPGTDGYISSSGKVSIEDGFAVNGDICEFMGNRWHLGGGSQRFYFGFDSTTYFQGYGATPFILRNGSGTDLVSIASNGNTSITGVIHANYVGANIRIKADGGNLDGALVADGAGNLFLGDFASLTRGWRINPDGTMATLGTGATTFNGDVLALTRLGVGASGFGSEKVRIQDTVNSPLSALIRNDDAGSSATSGLVLNAYGNSWGIRIGSTANNSNALEIREDALGANTLRFKMDVGGNATFNNIVTATGFGVGVAADASLPFRALASSNATIGMLLNNTSTGSSASSAVIVESDAGQAGFRQYSAAHSVWPGTTVISSPSGGSGLVLITSGASNPIEFHTDNTLRATISDTGMTVNGPVTATSLALTNGSDKPLTSYRDASYSGWHNGTSFSSNEAYFMGDNAHYFAVGGTNRLEVGASGVTIQVKMDVGGAATFNDKAKMGDFTVATLPSASANAGYECNVTDSSVTTFGSTVAGGGSSRVKLYSNGTNWTVQAA